MGRRGSMGGGARAAAAGSPGDRAALGLTLRPADGLGRGHVTVRVDVGKFDASLAADPSFHVGPGGKGGIGGRYAQFDAFAAKARADGTAIQQPRGGVDAQGQAYLSDGRHRFAWFRDHGARSLTISVPRAEAARARKRFGAE